jgi:hypothetical protein
MVYPFKAMSDSDEMHNVCVKDKTDTGKDGNKAGTAPDLVPNTSAGKAIESIVTQPHTKKRGMSIDESLLSPEEADRLMTKRAYNRECAERARKRGKELVSALQQQVHDIQEDKNELRRTVAAMEKQMMKLQQENDSLLLIVKGQQEDRIPRHIGGMRAEASAGLYAFPQQHSNLLAFPQVENQKIETLSQSWDYQKWLLLQQLRK